LPSDGTPRQSKYYVDDVEVSVVSERVQYLDGDGKLITETLKDYTRETVRHKRCRDPQGRFANSQRQGDGEDGKQGADCRRALGGLPRVMRGFFAGRHVYSLLYYKLLGHVVGSVLTVSPAGRTSHPTIPIRWQSFKIATTDFNHGHPVYLNLLAGLTVTGINQVWIDDITYIRISKRFVYLAPSQAPFSRVLIAFLRITSKLSGL